LWAAPDFQSIAFGREGEVLAAKVRLVISALAGLIPLQSALLRTPGSEAKIGLGAAITVLVLGAIVLRVAQRPKPPAWLGLFTCLLDVSTVSLVNAGFVFSGNPLAATNSRVVFCCYFVALALVCLRQDWRWCLIATAVAMAEYGAIVLWSAAHYDLHGPAFALSGYGRFNWDNQVARLLLLAAVGAIGAVLVVQSRGYWKAVIRYLDAFPLGVIIAGADSKSRYANLAAQDLLGRAIPAGVEVADLNTQLFLGESEELYPPRSSTIARALSGESTECDDMEIQRPESRIAVEAWGSPVLDTKGRVTHAIAVFHDQTRRRRAEEEMRRLGDMLREANAELERRTGVLAAVAEAAERLFQLVGRGCRRSHRRNRCRGPGEQGVDFSDLQRRRVRREITFRVGRAGCESARRCSARGGPVPDRRLWAMARKLSAHRTGVRTRARFSRVRAHRPVRTRSSRACRRSGASRRASLGISRLRQLRIRT